MTFMRGITLFMHYTQIIAISAIVWTTDNVDANRYLCHQASRGVSRLC